MSTSYGMQNSESTRVVIPELMGSSTDLSHCIDCSYGNRHLHKHIKRNNLVVRNQMSGILDIFGDLFNVFKKIADQVKEVVKKSVRSIMKGLPGVLKKLQRLAGNMIVYMNPISNTLMLVGSWKVTANLTKQVDRYTGGMITDFTSISTLPGRVIKGNEIPKEELIRDALFCARVGAVVLSGGTAASIVGATSNQLQQGELGQSELGRTVLTIAQVAAVAAMTGQAWQEIAKKQAVNTAGQAAAEETAQNTALGKTEFGRLIIQATLVSATASVNGTTAQNAVTELGKSSSKEIAVRELAEKLNVPYADKIARGLVDNIDKLKNISEADLAKILNGMDPSRAIAALGSAIEKMPDVFSNIGDINLPDIDFKKVSDKVIAEIERAPDNIVEGTTQLLKETSEVPSDIAKAVSQLKVPTKAEFKDFMKELKNIKSDFMEFLERVCYYQTQVDAVTGVGTPVQICKNSLARYPIKDGNNIRYVYYFDDGSMWASPWEDNTGLLKLAALVGLALVGISQIGDT
jgi:hypothetical protein